MATQKRRPGAPRGNTNSKLPEGKEPQRGLTAMMSMPYEERVQFEAAAALCEGHTLSDEECLEVWRRVDRLARAAFIKQYHGDVDPEIMVY
jgi:hypothetical protein